VTKENKNWHEYPQFHFEMPQLVELRMEIAKTACCNLGNRREDIGLGNQKKISQF
jgi:hypothetical protein